MKLDNIEYNNLQEINENRKKRLLAYSSYIENRTKDQMSEVVEKLKLARIAQGKSQQDIADATGMAAPNIARIESCKRIPTLQALMKYADAVGLQVEVVLKN